MVSAADLKIVVDDTDTIKVYRKQLIDALDCVYPHLKIVCEDISMNDGDNLTSPARKVIYIIDAGKNCAENGSIPTTVTTNLNSNTTSYLVITLIDLTNINRSEVEEDNESTAVLNEIKVHSMTEIEKWWPAVVQFVFPRNQNARETSFSVIDNSKSSFSEQKKIQIQTVLKGFGCSEVNNKADVTILIEDNFEAAKKYVEQAFPRYKLRSEMKNVHILLLNANTSQFPQIHGISSVHGHEQIPRLTFYCMIDNRVISARRSPSKLEIFGRRTAAVGCILLNIPLLSVWVALMYASVFGATLLFNIQGHNRVIAALLYFVHTVIAVVSISFGCVLLPEEYRKSNDIRLSAADIILVCFVVVPLSCCLWGSVGCFFINRMRLISNYMHVFDMPGLLWRQFDLEIIDTLSSRLCYLFKQIHIIFQKVILVFLMFLCIVLNLPLIVVLCSFLMIGPIASLVYLHFLVEVEQFKTSTFYHFANFQSSALISTASLVIGVVLSRYKRDFWDYGDTYMGLGLINCPYRRNCYTSYDNISLSHDHIIVIFCIIIPFYFLAWVSLIGFIAEKTFHCKYGVLSIPSKLFSKIKGNTVEVL